MRRSLVLLAALGLVGCGSSPRLRDTTLSLPSSSEAAKLVVSIDGQPVVVRFDPVTYDHLTWTEYSTDDAPPKPLAAAPSGGQEGAWVLRARTRGSKALSPIVYMAQREGEHGRYMIYTTEEEGALLEPGTAFELGDGPVRVSSPSGPAVEPDLEAFDPDLLEDAEPAK
jgi:hypothetical protein